MKIKKCNKWIMKMMRPTTNNMNMEIKIKIKIKLKIMSMR